jgi:hypothetical protein
MAGKSMEEEIDAIETFADTRVTEEPKEEPPKEERPEEAKPEDPPKEEPEKPEEKREEVPPGEPREERQDYGKEGHTPKGVQKRFSDFSRQVRGLKDENAQLKAEIEKLKQGQPKEQPKGRDQFQTDEEWIDYRAGLKAREMFETMKKEADERAEMDAARTEYFKAEEAARLKVDDFDDVMATQVDLPVDKATYMYVMKSPQGAMIQYTLRKIEAVRNQFLAAPQEGKLAVIKGIENRLNELEKQRQAQPPAQQATPPAPPQVPAQEPPRAPEIREPQPPRTVPARRLDPATCSMDEWMENGD